MARTAVQSARVCDNNPRQSPLRIFIILLIGLLSTGKICVCLSAANNDTVIIFGDRLSRVRQQIPNFEFSNNGDGGYDSNNEETEYAASVIEAPKNINGDEEEQQSGRRFDENYPDFHLSSDEIFRHLFINKHDPFKLKNGVVPHSSASIIFGQDTAAETADDSMRLNIEHLFNLRQKNIQHDVVDVDDAEQISVPTTSATRYSVTRSVSTRVNKRTDNDMRVNSSTATASPSAITTTRSADIMEALKQHRLEMSTEYFYVPERRPMPQRTTASPVLPSNIVTASTPLLITAPSHNYPSVTATCIHCANASGSHANGAADNLYTSGIIRKEVWSIPVLIIAIISLFIMIAFEIFVLCKASQTTPSRRHLFLGQMLLLGLFSCSSLAALITITPTPFICATIRFGIGVAYALVFAALLVKCVFLISLNTGVYLPAPYQGLLLFFAVLIQVVIGIQWLMNSPPMIHVISSSITPYTTAPAGLLSTTRHRGHLLVTAVNNRPEPDVVSQKLITLCQTPYIDILISLVYVFCLILFVAVLAIKSRGIRDNYREATYIGLAVGFTIPLWLMWTLSGLIMIERHRDACLAVGLLTTSLIIFLVMFLPKGRQLAAMGKEGVYVEDRDDRFSSLSRAGSTGYSPSFFHFKPMKYAPATQAPAMNTATTGGGHVGATAAALQSGFGSGATSSSHKRHPTAITTLGGDHLALYPAASSYTRMYHCYPCASGIPAALCNPPAPNALHHHHYTPTPGSIFLRSDDGNVYTTLEPTLSSNPNVYFQRGSGLLHPGMMY